MSGMRVIGTLYDADRGTAWLGVSNRVYRWWSSGGWGHPQADGYWTGIHASDLAAEAAGEVVMSNSLIYRLNSPADFERQGPYISITSLDDLPDRTATLGVCVHCEHWSDPRCPACGGTRSAP